MTDLGPTAYYLDIKVNISASKEVITQKTYIKKLFDLYQMSDCNQSPTLMIERLNLELGKLDFTPNPADITAYKKFTRSVQ